MPVQFSYLGKGNCTNKTCGLNTGINPHDRIQQLEDKVAHMIAAFKDCPKHITYVIYLDMFLQNLCIINDVITSCTCPC